MVNEVVVGPGSLGLFIALDRQKILKKYPYFVSKETGKIEKILKFNKKYFYYKEKTYALEDFLNLGLGSGGLRFFVCTHGGEVRTFVRELLSHGAHLATCAMDFYFCSNGLLDKDISKSLVQAFPHCRVFRALVYASLMTQEDLQNGPTVVHHGGNRVVFGLVEAGVLARKVSDSNSGFDSDSHLNTHGKSQIPEGVLRSGFCLKWHWSNNIQIEEIIKFYVNFMLLLVFKKQPIVNGDFFKFISKKRCDVWTEEFLEVFSISLDKKSLFLEHLESTLESTAANINSLTLAWYCGNPGPAFFFIRQFLNCIQQNEEVEPMANE